MLGGAVFLAGGALLGTAITASAGTPTLSFSPNTGIPASAPNQAVFVTVAGFTGHAKGGLSQCNVSPSEPTILDATTGEQEPVSCQPFVPIKTNAKGHLPTTGYGIQAGFNGPPDSGTDSVNNGDAATDAANYPCPPTAAQVAAGGVCNLVFTDTLGETASEAIVYNFDGTTTTTAPPVVGCTPAPSTGTSGAASVTVTPGTCLTGNEKVTITGTGLAKSSIGSILECNGDPAAPTIMDTLAGKGVPVGCTSPANGITPSTSTDASGNLNTTWTIVTGTIGPPDTGTDSSGGSAATDAAKFPCPVTTAEQTASIQCAIIFGDLAKDQVIVPISFGANAASNPTGGGAKIPASAPAAAKATTKASTGSLAFTGAGPGLWIMGVTGLALLLLGGSLLVLVDAPRRMVSIALHRGRRTPDRT
jgi:hypothetical protein